jgi:SOS response associated peptidase (SRAP)
VRKDGPKLNLDVYAFLTTTPNRLVATINHERMPVLLTQEQEFATWLSGAPQKALALAREYPSDQMRIVEAGLTKQDRLDVGSMCCNHYVHPTTSRDYPRASRPKSRPCQSGLQNRRSTS